MQRVEGWGFGIWSQIRQQVPLFLPFPSLRAPEVLLYVARSADHCVRIGVTGVHDLGGRRRRYGEVLKAYGAAGCVEAIARGCVVHTRHERLQQHLPPLHATQLPLLPQRKKDGEHDDCEEHDGHEVAAGVPVVLARAGGELALQCEGNLDNAIDQRLSVLLDAQERLHALYDALHRSAPQQLTTACACGYVHRAVRDGEEDQHAVVLHLVAHAPAVVQRTRKAGGGFVDVAAVLSQIHARHYRHRDLPLLDGVNMSLYLVLLVLGQQVVGVAQRASWDVLAPTHEGVGHG
mmetsp:Transcript_1876/g.4363  ORF Transcript_1876/g.4363 Transcript_1876/m.4363 type:complete len:291 (+) Transcript_1876:1344-2216(+)